MYPKNRLKKRKSLLKRDRRGSSDQYQRPDFRVVSDKERTPQIVRNGLTVPQKDPSFFSDSRTVKDGPTKLRQEKR